MAIAELVMPKLGESIMEATILKWHKKVGDSVKLDETVLDIATDKVDSEVPSTAEGTITEILFNENDVVPIGTVIARMNTITAVVSQPERSETPAPVQSAPIVAAPVVAPALQPQPVAVTPPQPIAQKPESRISEPVFEVPYQPAGNPVELLSKPAANRFYSPLVLNIANSEGISLSELERIPGTGNDGRVSKKDILQYIVDKKAGRVPAFQQAQPPLPQPVYVAPTPQPQPQLVPTPVVVTPEPVYVVPQPPVPPVSQPKQEEVPADIVVVTPPPQPEPIKANEPAYVAPQQPQPVAQPETHISEPVTNAVVPENIQPVQPVQPLQPIPEPVIAPVHTPTPVSPRHPERSEGPETRISEPVSRNPVPERSEGPSHIPTNFVGKLPDPRAVTVTGATEIMEMDRMRKLIAKHMVDSKHTSPHVTSFAEADVTNMVVWREKMKKEFEFREGTKLTFTPMFIECLVAVMRRFPLINCSIDGDKVVIKKDINIGMATALPSGNLIVPVIKCADQLSIVGLSKAVNGLADAARNSKLKPEDTTGGTFTLTNVGTFGSLMGTPIINQPQVAILAVGAIKKRPVVIESPDGDTIGIRHMMYLSLSYDHRIVDGSIGASFLTEVAKEFEKWDATRQWFHYL
jgi:pyruvate/2-oxoglutarate dehydrogenase complex dihydrolipoamide acyltransferase (E2) component